MILMLPGSLNDYKRLLLEFTKSVVEKKSTLARQTWYSSCFLENSILLKEGNRKLQLWNKTLHHF